MLLCFLSKYKIQSCPGFALPTTVITPKYHPSMNHEHSICVRAQSHLLHVIYSCSHSEWTGGMLSGFLFIISCFSHLIFLLPENLISLLFTIPTNEEVSWHEVDTNPAANLSHWPPLKFPAALYHQGMLRGALKPGCLCFFFFFFLEDNPLTSRHRRKILGKAIA